MLKGLNNTIFTTFSVISCIQTVAVYLYILFMTHNATAQEYASYISTTYIIDFAVSISLFGFNLIILRENKDYIHNNIISIITCSGVLIGVIFSVYCLLNNGFSATHYFLCFCLIVMQYIYQLGTCLQIKFNQNNLAFYNAVINFCFVLITLTILRRNDTMTCQNVLITRITQLAIFALISYSTLLKHIIPIYRPTLKSFILNIKTALPIGGGIVLGTINLFIDKFILTSQPPEDIALYSIARFEIPFIGIFTSNLSLVFMPKIQEAICHNRWDDTRTSINTLFQYGWYLNTIIFTLIFCNAGFIIETLYSAEYSEATIMFQIIACSYILKIVPYTNIIVALGIERIIVPRLFIEMVLQVLISLLFLHLWGIIGLAISVVFVLIFWSIPYNIYYICRTSHSQIGEIVPFKSMTLFFIKCFIPCLILTTVVNNHYSLLALTLSYIAIAAMKEIKYIYKNTR